MLPVAGSPNTRGRSTIRAAAGLATGISITSIENKADFIEPGSATQLGSSLSDRTLAVPDT
jgi:hypothetical protein